MVKQQQEMLTLHQQQINRALILLKLKKETDISIMTAIILS